MVVVVVADGAVLPWKLSTELHTDTYIYTYYTIINIS